MVWMQRFVSCSCRHETMKGSLPWQLHLVRNLSCLCLTKCTSPPRGRYCQEENLHHFTTTIAVFVVGMSMFCTSDMVYCLHGLQQHWKVLNGRLLWNVILFVFSVLSGVSLSSYPNISRWFHFISSKQPLQTVSSKMAIEEVTLYSHTSLARTCVFVKLY